MIRRLVSNSNFTSSRFDDNFTYNRTQFKTVAKFCNTVAAATSAGAPEGGGVHGRGCGKSQVRAGLDGWCLSAPSSAFAALHSLLP